MPSLKQFDVQTHRKTGFVNITAKVRSALADSGIKSGLCVVYVPHTTAGVTINEAADPDVVDDILKTVNKLIPLHDNYAHSEGNSAAHIKASLFGSSVCIPVENGELCLGTWQGIFFCEFDGPRHRHCFVKVSGTDG
ncbi:MAG: YjbQ family protein [Spirochaetaceae bacterium]|nr:MAG: YjbQ family protein [Spirochaetaceae bacterium]